MIIISVELQDDVQAPLGAKGRTNARWKISLNMDKTVDKDKGLQVIYLKS